MNKKAKHLAMLSLLDQESNYYYGRPITINADIKINDRWFNSDSGYYSYHVYRKYKDAHIYPLGDLGPDWVCVSSKEFYKNED